MCSSSPAACTVPTLSPFIFWAGDSSVVSRSHPCAANHGPTMPVFNCCTVWGYSQVIQRDTLWSGCWPALKCLRSHSKVSHVLHHFSKPFFLFVNNILLFQGYYRFNLNCLSLCFPFLSEVFFSAQAIL